MDAKRLAMVLSITALSPLFVILFVDAIYSEPSYETYCDNIRYDYPSKVSSNCTFLQGPPLDECYRDNGIPVYSYDENGCQTGIESCDYCAKDYNDAMSKYNRNIFFILLPVGLAIVLIGIYLSVDYLGAGLMFAGLITMFYATMRYFSELDKVFRALIILAELLLIMWIGYKKIDEGKNSSKNSSKKSKKRK